jgi:flavin-dependent dehydrogenase
MKYDVIVVGARCAGSSLAMLLARSGARVLLTDRATFPSDTFNGHYIHPAGVRSLQSWGLLDRVLTPGGPRPVHTVRMDYESIAFTGRFGWPDGQRALALAPRRHRLDALLVDAAAEAGAEVRQAFAVEDLVWDGQRVVGIRGRQRGGAGVEERADVVVGADGLHSLVASKVGAQAYEVEPAHTCVYYSHWADLPPAGLEIWLRPGRYALSFPTDAGLTCVAIGWKRDEFARVRANVEAEFLSEVERLPELAARMAAGRRVEPLRGTADLPTYLRVPYGPGWALVGDAGCRVDPITGEGITDAFRDAEFLAQAIRGGELHEYQRRRDEAVLPVYRYTQQRARLEPLTPQQERLLSALQLSQPDADRFVGLTAGTTPFAEFFAPENIARIVSAEARAA